MDAWLASPKKFASGTKMSFAGLGNPEDRANIILYLNSQGSNLPLPAPEAAPAAGRPKPPRATPPVRRTPPPAKRPRRPTPPAR
jgi:cytochrome c